VERVIPSLVKKKTTFNFIKLNMIGVVSKPHEYEVVEEFFELFKIPWEFYDPNNQHYDVLLVTGQYIPQMNASLIVVYSTEKSMVDEFEGINIDSTQEGDEYGERDNIQLPIYGKTVTFTGVTTPVLLQNSLKRPLGYETYKGEQRIIRIGYDLFEEILFLITKGQPAVNALIPTLDIHIAMLRHWIIDSGVHLVEIPPVPLGYRFITCLTHDVDFIGIRYHFLDHSMMGFLYRATVGSLLGAVKGRVSVSKLFANLKAACSLPLVFWGMSPDPWDQFDRCLEIEKGASSTFLFIPFKNRAGEGFSEGRARRRSARYDVKDAGSIIRKLVAQGCEIGVHGIDSWHNIESGKQELSRIQMETDYQSAAGIRMHWLCHNEQTFKILEKAGYLYDSTFGYNETVGFKAGTTQVFKPVGADTLLEIPLHIQDTALFRKGGLNLSEVQAEALCRRVINDAVCYGGVLTVSWHQRSFGPERLWGGFYEKLIAVLKENNAWFATASEITEWFRMRRSARFETCRSGQVSINFDVKNGADLPQLVLRSYRQKNSPAFETQPIEV